MSSEHATEPVSLAEVREGDMLQDPKSGNWIKVTQTVLPFTPDDDHGKAFRH
jgi:hypothetical protein